MNDDQFQRTVTAWLIDDDTTPPDSQQSARQVAARLPKTRQQSRWWPLPLLRRSPAPPPAIPDTEYQPSPIPATNGHSPTVTRRTHSLFSPAKAITAGALVFAVGGVLLIAQPFDQQDGSVPGAATDEGRPAIEKVTGQHVRWTGPEPPDLPGLVERYGCFDSSPDCVSSIGYYRDEQHNYRAEMSDERLSGTVRIAGNNDRLYYGEPGDLVEGPSVHWGTVNIENEAGSWVGTHTYLGGVGEPVVEYWEVVGTGAYEGWSAILHRGPRLDDGSFDDTHPVYGVVFSGNLPPDRESHLPE